jgi:hypothetical protein
LVEYAINEQKRKGFAALDAAIAEALGPK